MTIDITFLRNNTGCLFTAIGSVTGKEIIDAHQEVILDKHFKNLKFWLIDRTQCVEFLATPDELIGISSVDNAAAKNNPDLLVAIVSATDHQYGMTRLYSAYIDKNGFKTCLFRAKEEAEKWLESKLLE